MHRPNWEDYLQHPPKKTPDIWRCLQHIRYIIVTEGQPHCIISKDHLTENLPLLLATKCTPSRDARTTAGVCKRLSQHHPSPAPGTSCVEASLYLVGTGGFLLLSFWTQRSFSYTTTFSAKNSPVSTAHSMRTCILLTNSSAYGSYWLHVTLPTSPSFATGARTTAPPCEQHVTTGTLPGSLSDLGVLIYTDISHTEAYPHHWEFLLASSQTSSSIISFLR